MKTEKEAMAAFKKACGGSDPMGCLGLAYLERRAKLRQCRAAPVVCNHEEIMAAGSESLSLAIVTEDDPNRDAICWYRHIIDDVDPLSVPEEPVEFETPEPRSWFAFDVGPSFGYFPADRHPWYLDWGARAFIAFPQLTRYMSFYFNGTISAKSILAENTQSPSRKLERVSFSGLGLESGLTVGPDPQRFYLRATFGFASGKFSTVGFRAAIGKALGNHVLELGTSYETMPAQFVNVNAFGKMTGNENQMLAIDRWTFVPFLQYGYRMGSR